MDPKQIELNEIPGPGSELPTIVRAIENLSGPPGFDEIVQLSTIHLKEKKKKCCGDQRLRFKIGPRENEVLFVSAQTNKCCSRDRYKVEIQGTVNSKSSGPVLLKAKLIQPCCDSGCDDKGMVVEAPPGNVIGFVNFKQGKKCCDGCCECCDTGCQCKCQCQCNGCCTCCLSAKPCDCCADRTIPVIFIENESHELKLTVNIDIPGCKCCCDGPDCICCADDFVYTLRCHNNSMKSYAGLVIGEVRKHAYPCLKLLCGNALDHYSTTFPQDLHLKMKLLVICGILYLRNIGG